MTTLCKIILCIGILFAAYYAGSSVAAWQWRQNATHVRDYARVEVLRQFQGINDRLGWLERAVGKRELGLKESLPNLREGRGK